mmetsp:Transcript_136160/g.435569  ORF Transcript_136160/g.435569 Transcript_136160/m.435569 type:complete len:301 (+) Transcript_136160:900-1802(+)
MRLAQAKSANHRVPGCRGTLAARLAAGPVAGTRWRSWRAGEGDVASRHGFRARGHSLGAVGIHVPWEGGVPARLGPRPTQRSSAGPRVVQELVEWKDLLWSESPQHRPGVRTLARRTRRRVAPQVLRRLIAARPRTHQGLRPRRRRGQRSCTVGGRRRPHARLQTDVVRAGPRRDRGADRQGCLRLLQPLDARRRPRRHEPRHGALGFPAARLGRDALALLRRLRLRVRRRGGAGGGQRRGAAGQQCRGRPGRSSREVLRLNDGPFLAGSDCSGADAVTIRRALKRLEKLGLCRDGGGDD